MRWEPLITDEKTKQEIINIISTIANDLATTSSKSPSLIGDNAGISLFWEYLFLHSKNNLHHSYCVRCINSSLDAISTTSLSYNLSGGISGILWAYSHLANIGSININLNDVIKDDIHQFFADSAKYDIERFNYDYLHGGLSVLPYYLERSDNRFCRNCISEIIIGLEKKADELPEGISWMEGFHYISNNVKRYNLGMAHGIPSILVLLGRVIEKDIASEKAEKLLERSINWLIAQKNENGINGFFPTVIPGDSYFRRVSWCYGDLGIAIALFQVGAITNNVYWKDEAIKIAKVVATRFQPDADVMDTCFCHGTVGNAHLFNRLYNYTGLKEFKDAAVYWYIETLNFYKINGHFKFLAREKGGSNPKWEDSVGILEGIAGTGLSFLASIYDTEPKWDRCFLLS